MDDLKNLSLEMPDEAKMFLGEIMEVKKAFKDFKQTDIRDFFETEGKEDLEILQTHYRNEIYSIPEGLKKEVDDLLMDTIGDIFFEGLSIE